MWRVRQFEQWSGSVGSRDRLAVLARLSRRVFRSGILRRTVPKCPRSNLPKRQPRRRRCGSKVRLPGVVMHCVRHQSDGPAFIAPGRPWQKSYVENCHSKLRQDCLNREFFRVVEQSDVIIGRSRSFGNQQWPRSALGYRMSAQDRRAAPQAANIDVRLTA